MTTKEAIGAIQKNYPNCNAYSVLREALDIAIAALREKAENERRFVVKLMPMGDVKYSFIVEDTSPDACVKWVATHIETEQAAQSIADIYEGVKP